jgi:hypothetical protein
MLVMRNGECHFLTWRERVAYFFGKTDAAALERKYRPRLSDHSSDHHLAHAVHSLLGALWEMHDWASREQFEADPSVKNARAVLSRHYTS